MAHVMRAVRDRTVRAFVIGLALLAPLVVPTPSAGGQVADPPSRWGRLDLVQVREDSTRIVGWAAAPTGTAPVVRVVVDGQAMPRFEASQRRIDADLVTPRDVSGWGWDLTVDIAATESVCVSVVIEDQRHGIDCWSAQPGVMLPALGGGDQFGTGGALIRYSVEVEAAAGHHPEDVARIVDEILGDPRSWAANGEARFQRVSVDRADLRIKLATPATTDRLCLPFRTGGQLSCNVEDVRIVFNLNRWEGAVSHWTASLDEYRGYLVNHEVGHSLDYVHVPCPAPGQPAPVMMQQSKSLGGCLPNPWPYPEGGGQAAAAADKPDAEPGEATPAIAASVRLPSWRFVWVWFSARAW